MKQFLVKREQLNEEIYIVAGLLAASLHAQQPRERKEEKNVICYWFSHEESSQLVNPIRILVNGMEKLYTDRTLTGPTCKQPEVKYRSPNGEHNAIDDFVLVAIVPPDKVEHIPEKKEEQSK